MFSGRFSPKIDDVGSEPVPVSSFAEFGDFQLVGHGSVTNEFCGQFLSLKGCLNVDFHGFMTLDGKSYASKVFVRRVHHWCCKPSCPVCFIRGWAVRQAKSIEGRLKEASKKFGLVEHIVASAPSRDYGLSFEGMRRKAKKVLFSRGVVGGCLIWHGFRYNLRKHWFWSPHYHCLGYILGGYSRCRNCKRKWNCLKGCGGFDDRNYHDGFLRDGWIVKVLGKRVSVFYTAYYLLNHSSIKKNVKRFHVVTWFGCCSYRKLKVTVEKRKELCPICNYELIDISYCGVKSLDVKVRESFEDYLEDGCVAWVERVKRKYGSGNYE